MSEHKPYGRQTRQWVAMAGIVAGLVLWGISADITYSQSNSSATSPASPEQLKDLLQQAANYLQQQELTAAYDLYLRVLGIEAANETARENVFSIMTTYKTRLATAQQSQTTQQAELLYQQYRNCIREFLKLRTNQLKRELQRYGELMAKQKSGENVKPELIPTLTIVVQILQDIQTIYMDFPQAEDDTADTQKVVDRLKETITKYKEELLSYQ